MKPAADANGQSDDGGRQTERRRGQMHDRVCVAMRRRPWQQANTEEGGRGNRGFVAMPRQQMASAGGHSKRRSCLCRNTPATIAAGGQSRGGGETTTAVPRRTGDNGSGPTHWRGERRDNRVCVGRPNVTGSRQTQLIDDRVCVAAPRQR